MESHIFYFTRIEIQEKIDEKHENKFKSMGRYRETLLGLTLTRTQEKRYSRHNVNEKQLMCYIKELITPKQILLNQVPVQAI